MEDNNMKGMVGSEPNKEFVILAENLEKDYNGEPAVKGISFRVNRQECFGFLGPNGAGKSTTVKMIYGASPVSGGRLLILGMDIQKKARAIKKRIGVVPQENNLDPDLKVIDNLLIYASFFGIKQEKARDKAMELLDFFELSGQAKASLEKLSGGMKRRLTIARALINSPEILILDEPTTGLDPQARHLVWQRLRHLKEQGVTLLLTTHYMEEASQLCDRLVIMDQGIILEEGHPQDLLEKHIGKEILEVGVEGLLSDDVLNAVAGLIKGYQQIGDNLFLYPYEGMALLARIQEQSFKFSHQLLRPASLEDVFLKLTGRGLRDDHKSA